MSHKQGHEDRVVETVVEGMGGVKMLSGII
jgi:hypothetical protein